MSYSDGGYYALKGFEFQIDKTILEILKVAHENVPINIEQIQDIDSDSFVMQVKYKETQKFTPSKIKKPIIQLLYEFDKNQGKDYYLYAHFADLNGYEQYNNDQNKITANNLDVVLGDSKDVFSLSLKESFTEKFYLDFAPTFQNQFNQVIDELKKENFIGNSDDEAVFYYANIADFIRKIVVNNIEAEKRVVTKKQLFDYLSRGKHLIFNSAFKEYKGATAYFDFIKTKFVKAKKNQENLIFLGDIETNSSVSLSKLILEILERYFNRAQRDIVPLTIVISDEKASPVKNDLIENNVIFNDGYETIKFSQNIFFTPPVINKQTSRGRRSTDNLDKISYKVKLLSYSTFKSIEDYSTMPQMIYYFDSEIEVGFNDVSFIKVDKLNTKYILDIFTF